MNFLLVSKYNSLNVVHSSFTIEIQYTQIEEVLSTAFCDRQKLVISTDEMTTNIIL